MANKKLFTYLLVFLLVLSFADIYASGGRRNGTAGAQELLIPVGARGLALNSANVAGLSGVESIFYNPAGLGKMAGNVETMFSYMNYIADINLVYAAAGVDLSEIGTLAFTLKALDFGDIPVTTVERPEGTGYTFSPSFTVIGLSYANFLTERIKAGVTFNLVSESIMNTSATAFAIDVGIQYNQFAYVNGLQLGVVLKNFGPQSAFTGSDLIRTADDPNTLRGNQFYQIEAAKFELPSQLILGFAYEKNLDEQFSSMITTSFQNNNFSNDEYKIGAEVGYQDIIFLRGGYSYVSEASDNQDENIFGPTMGLGLNISGDINMTIDYAYRFMEYFDDNQLFSLKVIF